MNIELFVLNGYGLFVWPAFIFTFLSCLYLYLKTRSEFKKQEKEFLLEFGKFQNKKIEFIKRKQTTKRVLTVN